MRTYESMAGRAVLLFLAALTLGARPSQADVVEYYHLDAIGNVRAVTNQSGAIVERHDYLPFGEEYNPQGGTQSRRFTGKERDSETGLDYFGARYYGPKIGRFTTVDPKYNWRASPVDPQRWNRYAYGKNNPVRYVDPNGQDAKDIIAGGINAFGSNLVLGAGRSEPLNPDFELGQRIGDVASIGAGLYETVVGGTVAAGGGALTLTGGGAAVGVPAAAVGAAVVVQGAAVSSSGLIHLMAKKRGDLPAKAEPNSTSVKDYGGGQGQIREYGPDGKATTDYDFGHDHGAGDPHAHDWDWSKTPPRQPGRPLDPTKGE
jgi:RHS repeat-associated protein